MPHFPKLRDPPPIGTPEWETWSVEYADWWCTVADQAGIDGLTRLVKENANPPSVPTVRRRD